MISSSIPLVMERRHHRQFLLRTGDGHLKLIDIDPSQVVLSRIGADLIISFASFLGSIKATASSTHNVVFWQVKASTRSSFQMETAWGRAEIWAKAWFRGTGGGDYITTTSPSAEMFLSGMRATIPFTLDLWANLRQRSRHCSCIEVVMVTTSALTAV